ncbi:Uncharacterised protein [BD1-7 clade bacterium]|uniref:Uncharacterized protein n=1 Tax=BD1-7 clade bacterium TaxID=2029982 RepID=A0A5S9Q8E9_9GAMM|nr:Uncharacterised protein [BD1-7 clade bacterium]CAA0115058.1 Uncharacterised protein [BD1-7 clade bacterium]
MENNALSLVESNPNTFTLTYTIQALKHHFTHIKQAFPIRFHADYLPKVSEYEINQVGFHNGSWRITCNHGAFFGVRGVIPRTYYSEALSHYFSQNDSALITFFNGFNHRHYHLAHLCEVKHSLPLQSEEESFPWLREEKAISHRLTKLLGDLSDGLPAEPQWLQYAGLIANRTLCVFGLEAILKDYFRIDCEVINTAAYYQDVYDQDCSKIGQKKHNNELGVTMFAGHSAALFSQFLDIHIYPKSADEMEHMRLDNRLADAICNLVYQYLHSTVRVRLFINIDSSMLPCLRMTAGSISLGFSSWLCTKHPGHSGKIVFPYKADLAAHEKIQGAML